MTENKMVTEDKRLAKGRRYFEYHCYEGEDSSDAELWHHTHQQVEVLKKKQDGKGDCEGGIVIYGVRFTDGFEWEVFNDELMASPSDYYRPDYSPTLLNY